MRKLAARGRRESVGAAAGYQLIKPRVRLDARVFTRAFSDAGAKLKPPASFAASAYLDGTLVRFHSRDQPRVIGEEGERF